MNPTLRLIDIPRIVGLARWAPSKPLVLVDNTFLSPFCWLAQRGAKTLAVRMKAHGLNALRVASFLTSHPAVEHVIYPGLASHPLHALARSSLSPHTQQFLGTLLPSSLAHGIPYDGMVSFRLRGGARSAEWYNC
jgi:cystathionine gamma-lyase